LMQRLVMMDYNANVRDEKVTSAYDKLTELNREGITEVTGRLIQYRPAFIERWEKIFRPTFDEFKKKVAAKGIVVPDRMIENYSVIITTAKTLEEIGLKLPFKIDHQIKFLIETITAQAEKRDTGSVIQRFFDTVLSLASEGIIRFGREYTFNGNILSLRITEVHSLYMDKHYKIFRQPGLGKSTLIQKLKDSGVMEFDHAVKQRIGGGNNSVYNFYYDKIGVDLLTVMNYWEGERARYATKSFGDGAQNMALDSRFSPASGENTGDREQTSLFGKNPKIKPETKNPDDMPF
jgi:hypothetical protein